MTCALLLPASEGCSPQSCALWAVFLCHLVTGHDLMHKDSQSAAFMTACVGLSTLSPC